MCVFNTLNIHIGEKIKHVNVSPNPSFVSDDADIGRDFGLALCSDLYTRAGSMLTNDQLSLMIIFVGISCSIDVKSRRNITVKR